MRIYVDADSCPVIDIVEQVAGCHEIPVTILSDSSHQYTSEYSDIIVISPGANAVDIALVNLCQPGDIVVTHDFGVAALSLGKGAKAIHECGTQYNRINIDALLNKRHPRMKAHKKKEKHFKGESKRVEEDDRRFARSFEQMVLETLQEIDDRKYLEPWD